MHCEHFISDLYGLEFALHVAKNSLMQMNYTGIISTVLEVPSDLKAS